MLNNRNCEEKTRSELEEGFENKVCRGFMHLLKSSR